MVFVSSRDGDYALFGVDAGDTHEWRLTKEKGDPSTPSGLFFQLQPAWSPNGRSLAFASKRDGRFHVYVMPSEGGDARRLTSGREDDTRPTWSPDGKRIAFARDGELYAVAVAGGTPQRLTREPGGDAADPAWSPDGRLIAYDYRAPGFSTREVWVVDADGGNPRRVTNLRHESGRPSWGPDGKRIAFQSNARGAHFEIYTIGLDGKGLSIQTTSDTDTIDPDWSPRGGRIAFSRDGSIQAVDRAGNAEQLTSGKNDSSPAWRP
jgi:TolB protein